MGHGSAPVNPDVKPNLWTGYLTMNDELLPKVCRSTLLIQSMVSFKPTNAVKNTPAKIM